MVRPSSLSLTCLLYFLSPCRHSVSSPLRPSVSYSVPGLIIIRGMGVHPIRTKDVLVLHKRGSRNVSKKGRVITPNSIAKVNCQRATPPIILLQTTPDTPNTNGELTTSLLSLSLSLSLPAVLSCTLPRDNPAQPYQPPAAPYPADTTTHTAQAPSLVPGSVPYSTYYTSCASALPQHHPPALTPLNRPPKKTLGMPARAAPVSATTPCIPS